MNEEIEHKDSLNRKLFKSIEETNGRIAYLEGLVASKTEALSKTESYLAERVANNGVTGRTIILPLLREAISATAETVAKYKAELIEPLLREVAMLRAELNYSGNHDEDCGIYNNRECSCSFGAALTNSQTTAQAYEQEVEARGAAKALESAMLAIDSMPIAVVGNSAATEDQILDLLRGRVEAIRSTSKKEGESDENTSIK